jgi:hypothetical protein
MSAMKNQHAGCGREGATEPWPQADASARLRSLVILIQSRPHGVVMDSNVKLRRICSAEGGLSRAWMLRISA